tara:strand:+ start:129 stop:407 length:279 start_codon:yes stop_codon:yes gene_type:complete
LKSSNKRPLAIVLLILFIGCIVATALSQLVSVIFPDGVVKEFLMQSISIGWGKSDEWIDLNVIKFKTGFYIDVSALSLIGMFISWYFLRYFR